MQAAKRRPGRPRRKEGILDYKHFVRAGIVMCAYDEARRSNEKHSTAVRQVVESVKQRHPEMRISETGVKRILAEWRPRNSRIILHFERRLMTEEEKAKYRWIQEHEQEKGLRMSVRPHIDPSKPVTKLVFGFAERPTYPRFNRKIPKE